MFTSRSARIVVTSASAPGRSRTGTRHSTTDSGRGIRGGRLRRARASVIEQRHERATVLVDEDPAGLVETLAQVVERFNDCSRIVSEDVRPDRRVTSRDAGHVPEAARSKAEHHSVFFGGVGREHHQVGSDEAWKVRDDRDEGVVARRRELYDVGSKGRHHFPDALIRVVVRRLRRGQHPRGAEEYVPVRSVRALLFRSRHRVATDEARVFDRADHLALHAADVGHDEARVTLAFARTAP